MGAQDLGQNVRQVGGPDQRPRRRVVAGNIAVNRLHQRRRVSATRAGPRSRDAAQAQNVGGGQIRHELGRTRRVRQPASLVKEWRESDGFRRSRLARQLPVRQKLAHVSAGSATPPRDSSAATAHQGNVGIPRGRHVLAGRPRVSPPAYPAASCSQATDAAGTC